MLLPVRGFPEPNTGTRLFDSGPLSSWQVTPSPWEPKWIPLLRLWFPGFLATPDLLSLPWCLADLLHQAVPACLACRASQAGPWYLASLSVPVCLSSRVYRLVLSAPEARGDPRRRPVPGGGRRLRQPGWTRVCWSRAARLWGSAASSSCRAVVILFVVDSANCRPALAAEPLRLVFLWFEWRRETIYGRKHERERMRRWISLQLMIRNINLSYFCGASHLTSLIAWLWTWHERSVEANICPQQSGFSSSWSSRPICSGSWYPGLTEVWNPYGRPRWSRFVAVLFLSLPYAAIYTRLAKVIFPSRYRDGETKI